MIVIGKHGVKYKYLTYSKLAGMESLLAKKIDKNTGQIPSKSYDNLNDYTESGIYNYVATNGVVYNRYKNTTNNYLHHFQFNILTGQSRRYVKK